jgi:hypothetical protein
MVLRIHTKSVIHMARMIVVYDRKLVILGRLTPQVNENMTLPAWLWQAILQKDNALTHVERPAMGTPA